jgi:hypothetical protein
MQRCRTNYVIVDFVRFHYAVPQVRNGAVSGHDLNRVVARLFLRVMDC